MNVATLALELKLPFGPHVHLHGIPGQFSRVPTLDFRPPLPDPSDVLSVRDGEILLNISVARESSRNFRERGEAVQPIDCDYLRGVVLIESLPNDLASVMLSPDIGGMEENRLIESGYKALAARIYHLVVSAMNQVINYARTSRGQYWLASYSDNVDDMQQQFYRWETAARLGEKRFHWRPISIARTLTLYAHGNDHYFTQEDWNNLRVLVGVRTPVRLLSEFALHADLLANSQAHLDRGHSKSALIEAVTALEVGLVRAAHHDGARWEKRLRGRVASESFERHVEQLGLRGTIDYLIPVLYTEEEIGRDLLSGCATAVDQRNRVVHKGQSIADELARTCVYAVSRMLSRLRELETQSRTAPR